MAMPRKSNVGDKHGMLTLIEWLDSRFSMFKCDCGNTCKKRSADVRNGRITSCGCARMGKARTHGFYTNGKKEKLYDVWSSIKQRCLNPKNKDYHMYGGRGITICDEWKKDYLCFRNWALKNGYNEGLSIDRIDNDKGYMPDNCRWITNKKNTNNTRKNHVITYNGETRTLAEWAEHLGISRTTLSARLNEYGWDVERALAEPAYKGKNQYQ